MLGVYIYSFGVKKNNGRIYTDKCLKRRKPKEFTYVFYYWFNYQCFNVNVFLVLRY